MEDQDSAFIKQATEAIVDISLDINNIDPIIKELLQRVKNTRNTSRHRKRPVASTGNGIKTGTHNGNVKVKKEDVGQGLTKHTKVNLKIVEIVMVENNSDVQNAP